MLKILPLEQGFSAKVAEIPSRPEIVAVRGTLDDSLFNAVEETGESAELAMRMTQIFGYDLDLHQWANRRLRQNLRRRVQQRGEEISGAVVPRSGRPTRLLH
jgi:hypothetical protein